VPLLLLVAQVIGAVVPAIGAVRAALPSHAAAGDTAHSETVLEKVLALLGAVAGTTWQDPRTLSGLFADLQGALGIVAGGGVVTGPALDLVTQAHDTVGSIAASLANYKAGDMAVISTDFSVEGIAGNVGAWSKTGNVARLLGEA